MNLSMSVLHKLLDDSFRSGHHPHQIPPARPNHQEPTDVSENVTVIFHFYSPIILEPIKYFCVPVTLRGATTTATRI